MAMFDVTEIIDGNTFDVAPEWKRQRQTGKRVRIKDYDVPESWGKGGSEARINLLTLILGKKVELGSEGNIEYDRLVCDVFFNGKNIIEYLR